MVEDGDMRRLNADQGDAELDEKGRLAVDDDAGSEKGVRG
jgi:hypothetical protein